MGGGFLNCAKSRELKSGLSIGISSVIEFLYGESKSGISWIFGKKYFLSDLCKCQNNWATLVYILSSIELS